MCEKEIATKDLPAIPLQGVDAERLAEAVNTLSAAWRGIVRAIEEVAGSFNAWLKSVAAAVEAQHELETALRWASCYYRPAFNRYHHTKKKRTRKKYEKKILAWYREEVLGKC